MAPFEQMLNRYFGEPGTPDRVEYDHKYRSEVNKLILGRMMRKIRAAAKR